MDETMRYVVTTFRYMKDIKRKGILAINEWIYDHLEYPDSVSRYIREARNTGNDLVSVSTVGSARGDRKPTII